jgi:hypothetical protein
MPNGIQLNHFGVVKMKKILLALAVASSIFAVTAAGASGLGTLTGGGTVGVVNTGTVSVTTTSCVDNLSIAYTYADATHQSITGLTLTGAINGASTCVGTTATVVLSDLGGTPYTQTGNQVFVEGSTHAESVITLGTAYNVVTNPLKRLSISVE